MQLTKSARERRALILTVYDFIARTLATNINKELTEVVVEELISQNDILKKKLLKVLIAFIN